MKNNDIMRLKYQRVKSYYKSLTINARRLWLTIIGIMVGIIVFSVGMIFSSSYQASFFEKHKTFGDDLVSIKNPNGFDLETIKYFDTQMPDELITYMSQSYAVSEFKNGLLLNYNMRGVSTNFLSNYFVETNDSGINEHPIVYEKQWYEGELFTDSDYANSSRKIIINYFGAYMLFKNKNPINEHIDINGYKYQIIGVVSNSDIVEEKIIQLNKMIKKDKITLDNARDYYPYIEVFMPISTFKTNFNEDASLVTAIIRLSNVDNCATITQNLQHYYSNELDKNIITISNKKIIMQDVQEVINEIKTMIYLITGFILLISGFTIMNTLFFNIKEKIPEIGIRKALGARGTHITAQIVFEGVFYVILALILGIAISIILSLVTLIILQLSGYSFLISINPLDFIIISLIMIFEGIVFSLFPAINAARMKIVDAIRFE